MLRGCRCPLSPIQSYFHPKPGLTSSIFRSSVLRGNPGLELSEERWGGKLCTPSPKHDAAIPTPAIAASGPASHVGSSIDRGLLRAATPRAGLTHRPCPGGTTSPEIVRRQMRGPGKRRDCVRQSEGRSEPGVRGCPAPGAGGRRGPPQQHHLPEPSSTPRHRPRR